MRPSTSRAREVIDRLYEEGRVVARSDGTTHELFPVAITRAEGEAARSWVIREAASRTLEVGLGYGVATLFLCDGLLTNGGADACHVVLDPSQDGWLSACGLQVLADAGLSEMVEFHATTSQLALPRFLSEGRVFDLALVDGDHRFDAVFLDLVYIDRLLRPKGVVFVDDYRLPAVIRAVSYCITNLDWTQEDVSADGFHHWTVLRTPSLRRERAWDEYIEF